MSSPRFCDQCGVSLIPLAVPHVRRRCDDCGRDKYIADPGEGGKGIRVEKGDTPVIPAGWLTLSLDPTASRGRFSRAGVAWFVSMLLTGEVPVDEAEVQVYLQRIGDAAWKKLKDSDMLAGLDLESESDQQRALLLVTKPENQGTIESWALGLAALTSRLTKELLEGASPTVVMYALRAQASQSVLVFKDSLEEQLWTGYQQTSAVYDLASAAAQTPAEETKIRALEPAFRQLDEATLHAWVAAEADIAPRLNVTGVEETVLRGLAKYHLGLRERERQGREREMDRAIEIGRFKVQVWQVVVATLTLGLAVGGFLSEVL